MSANDRLPLAIPPRDRFVRAIAERLSPDRIAEVHLFQPIRQGGVETGVAVIAADRPDEVDAELTDASASDEPVVESDAAEFLAEPEGPAMEENDDALSLAADFEEPEVEERFAPSAGQQRHTVFTAWYRLTLKGPDRGKWEFNLANEAVAPLDTIVAVARGVGERAGDADDPERWTGEHFRAALTEAGNA